MRKQLQTRPVESVRSYTYTLVVYKVILRRLKDTGFFFFFFFSYTLIGIQSNT